MVEKATGRSVELAQQQLADKGLRGPVDAWNFLSCGASVPCSVHTTLGFME